MAPSVVQTVTETVSELSLSPLKTKSLVKEPLKYSGSLDQFPHEDLTPALGTEFTSATQLSQLLKADNADELIRDLATLSIPLTIIPINFQFLNVALFSFEVRTSTSKLKRFLVPNSENFLANLQPPSCTHIPSSIPLNSARKSASSTLPNCTHHLPESANVSHRYYEEKNNRSAFASNGWHADITFEKVPSDYAILKIHTKPATGGDTLWASAYEAYDRLTPTFRGWLETLTATHQGTQFLETSKRLGFPLAKNRGAPENSEPIGDDLTAIHPVIRTNPVTGWKGLFVNRAYVPLKTF